MGSSALALVCIAIGFSLLFRGVKFAVPRITSADLTTLSQLLKDVYDPVIEELQNLEPFTWREFADGDDQLGGNGWTFETKTGGNQEGIGARVERQDLPDPGRQRYQKGLIYWKLLYGSYELTGPVIEAAKSNLYAFAVARTEEIQGLTRDVMKDFNRQVYGDGSGVLATFNAAGSGAQDNNTGTVTNGQYLRLNMVIDIWQGSTATLRGTGKRQITALTPQSNGTMLVTFDGASNAVSSGDVIIRYDAAVNVSNVRVGSEMEGLKKIADDGTVAATYLGISRTAVPLFKGHLFANAGTARNISLDLLQQVEDQVWRAANKRPDWIRTGLGQRRKYFDLVSPDKRYMTGTIDGGYERLDFNGNTLTVDVDHPLGEWTFLVKDVVRKYTLRKFGMLDFDGQTIRMQGIKDVWRGHVGMYGNLASKHPSCTARLIDCVEPAQNQWVS